MQLYNENDKKVKRKSQNSVSDRNFSQEEKPDFVKKAYSYNDAQAAIRRAREVIGRASVINGDERYKTVI